MEKYCISPYLSLVCPLGYLLHLGNDYPQLTRAHVIHHSHLHQLLDTSSTRNSLVNTKVLGSLIHRTLHCLLPHYLCICVYIYVSYSSGGYTDPPSLFIYFIMSLSYYLVSTYSLFLFLFYHNSFISLIIMLVYFLIFVLLLFILAIACS